MLSPHDYTEPRAPFFLGKDYAKAGAYEGAIRAFTEAIKLIKPAKTALADFEANCQPSYERGLAW